MKKKTGINCLVMFIIACAGEEVKPPEIFPLTSTSVDAGEYITLSCNLTTQTSNSINWNWYCDGSNMNSAFVNSVKKQSTLRFIALNRYDQTYCSCRASSYNEYDKSSNLQMITVYHVPNSSPSIQWKSPSYSSGVREGESIIFQCSLSSSANPPVTWSWFCGDEAIATGITNKEQVSELILKTEEKHDSKFCYCQATTNRSTLTYDRTSSRQKLQIYYIPKTSPKLSVVTSTSVDNGKLITLMCTLPTPGNPVIDWYWYCNGNSVRSSYVTSVKNQTILRFRAIKSYDQTECHCRAKYSKKYDSLSKAEKLTVFHVPSSSPSIRWISPSYSSSVAEGEKVILRCSLSSLGNPPVSWSWFCDESNIDIGITNKDTVSELELTAEAKYDNTFCYCQATTNRSSLDYDRTSSRQKLSVKYVPSINPVLVNLSATTAVTKGETIKLRCSLPRLGNPKISWSWTCGSTTLYKGISNYGNQSTIQFVAKAKHDKTKCFCRAKSSNNYDTYSNSQYITVFYVPSTYPQITSLTRFPVTDGSTITLRCTLSQLGNPPIKWSWICDGSDITDRVSNAGKTSEVVLVADQRFRHILCYCRARSGSLTFEYDKTSPKKIITVKEVDDANAIACESVSTTKYHAAIGVMVTLLGLCLVVIVVLVLKILGRGLCFGTDKDASRNINTVYNDDDQQYEVIQQNKQSKNRKENSIQMHENTTEIDDKQDNSYPSTFKKENLKN